MTGNVQRLTSEDAVQRGTGRGWDDWLAVLDGWSAAELLRQHQRQAHGQAARLHGRAHGGPGDRPLAEGIERVDHRAGGRV